MTPDPITTAREALTKLNTMAEGWVATVFGSVEQNAAWDKRDAARLSITSALDYAEKLKADLEKVQWATALVEGAEAHNRAETPMSLQEAIAYELGEAQLEKRDVVLDQVEAGCLLRDLQGGGATSPAANALMAEVEKLTAERDELHAEAKLTEESHADDQRMIDRISDIIGLPQDQELHTFAFELWASEQKSEIARLTSQLDQAEKVVAPFADFADSLSASNGDDAIIAPDFITDPKLGTCDLVVCCVDDIRRASQWIKDRQAKTDVAIGDK